MLHFSEKIGEIRGNAVQEVGQFFPISGAGEIFIIGFIGWEPPGSEPFIEPCLKEGFLAVVQVDSAIFVHQVTELAKKSFGK
jgi:hypothetical protein